eukprot:jgi/Picsp_1/1152/NSC_04633-R1_polyribonucleotide nucleotidyltransferase
MLRCVRDRCKNGIPWWLRTGQGGCWKSSGSASSDEKQTGHGPSATHGMRASEKSSGIDGARKEEESFNREYRFNSFGSDWKIQVGGGGGGRGGACATVTCGGTVVMAVAARVRPESFVLKKGKGSRRGATSALFSGSGLGDGYENDVVSVEYKERYFSAGKLPPPFHKRESLVRRDTELLASARIQKALLSAVRMGGCIQQNVGGQAVQLKLHVLSADPRNDPEIVAMNAGSVALSLASDVPWTGPIAAVRLVRSAQSGEFETSMDVLLPSLSSLSSGQVEEEEVAGGRRVASGHMVVAGTRQGVVYVQGAFDTIPSKTVMEGVEKGFREICASDMLDYQILCSKSFANERGDVALVPGADAVAARRIYTDLYGKIENEVFNKKDIDRVSLDECIDSVKEEMMVQLQNEGRWRSQAARIPGSGCVTMSDIDHLCSSILKRLLYMNLLEKKSGIGKKKYDDVRPCMVEAGVLPMAHGSSRVTSGSMCIVGAATCGGHDEQLHNEHTIFGEAKKRISVAYSQTSVSGPGSYSNVSSQKKEAESVNFLENAISPILPSSIENPFSFRVNIDSINADGSDQSFSVCAASAALRDLTLNISSPCTASTVSLLSENADKYGGEEFKIPIDESNAIEIEDLGSYVLLGEPSEMESICSDAKLAAAGSDGNLTACSLFVVQPGGLHIKALSDMFNFSDMLRKKTKSMMRSVSGKKNRAQFPKFGDMAIPKSTLSKVIGKDGQVLRLIEEQNRGEIFIDDEGNCKLFAPTPEEYRSLQEALMLASGSRLIPGRSYKGHITGIKDFGAFVKLPESNTDALLHISEISHEKIKAVEDVLQEGQEIHVQFLGRDQVGSLRVSRKAVLGNVKSGTSSKNE